MAEHALIQEHDAYYGGAAIAVLINIAADETIFNGNRAYEGITAAVEIVIGMLAKGAIRAALVTGGLTLAGLTIFDVIAGK